MLVCRTDDAAQALEGAAGLRVGLGMMAAAATLEGLRRLDDAVHPGLTVLRIQVAHGALRDEDLDLAMERVGEVLRQVDGEAARIAHDVGVDEDLVGLAEVEGQLELLEQLAVGLGAFAAHAGTCASRRGLLGERERRSRGTIVVDFENTRNANAVRIKG